MQQRQVPETGGLRNPRTNFLRLCAGNDLYRHLPHIYLEYFKFVFVPELSSRGRVHAFVDTVIESGAVYDTRFWQIVKRYSEGDPAIEVVENAWRRSRHG